MSDKMSGRETSAGVVVIRHDPIKGACILMLSVYGRFDLPKGHTEPDNPSLLATAARELFEEASFELMPVGSDLMASIPVASLISDENYKCSNVDSKTGKVKKDVYLYAAETLYAGPIEIRPNKDGIKEHDAAIWVPFDSVEKSRLHAYMKPGALWAMDLYSSRVLRR